MPIIDARYYKTLVLCPNKAIATELGPVISHGLPLAPVHIIHDYLTRRPLMDALKLHDPKVCFVDFATNLDTALAITVEIQALNSNLPVVALLPGDDPSLILKCLRQGAADFLIRPFTNDQMDSAVEKIARLVPAPAARVGGGKTIAVLPAKGACGATTIACNLAFQSKRLGSKKILLADLDPLTGTISFLLKLKSSYSFVDVISRQNTLDGDLWKQMINVHQGIDVLLAPENMMDGIDQLQDASSIFDFAQRTYETVIADCGNSYNNWNLSMARICDELLLVTTNELPALQAAQRALAFLETNRVEMDKVRIVVNRYEREIGLNADIISTALGTEVFQVIPTDYEAVQKSQMEGKPVPPGSIVGKNMAELATRVCGRKERSNNGSKPSSLSGLMSIFSKASS